jgi:hypothetical protein
MSILSAFGAWVKAQPRRTKQTFHSLTSAGRSEKRAKKLINLVERASADEFQAVAGSKGARYFLPGAPKTAPTISRREYIKRKYGATPEQIAIEHKIGARSYATPKSQKQAAKTRATRKFTKRFKRAPVEGSHEHTFLDKFGGWTTASFSGGNLIAMQNYRSDWQHALATGDGNFLKRYDDMEIFDDIGNRVFPETDIKNIREFLAGLSIRQRNRFEAEVNYLKERPRLAA